MQRVFTRLPYLSLALATAVAVFIVIAFFRLSYIYTFMSSTIPFALAIRLTATLFVYSVGSMSTVAQLFAIATSVLIGINVALLLVFYIRKFGGIPTSKSIASGTAGSVLALAIALFGFGCLSCGSIFLVTLVTAVGGTGLLAAMPFLGIAAGTAGIVLLIVSVTLLVRAINAPTVCPS